MDGKSPFVSNEEGALCQWDKHYKLLELRVETLRIYMYLCSEDSISEKSTP